jgi:hypothetical protein
VLDDESNRMPSGAARTYSDLRAPVSERRRL